MRVLRLCSVFESCTSDAAVDFDPVGGMQTHTAELTRQLDHLGVEQVVATARPPGSPTEQRTGEHGQVLRFGWRWARPRQMWSAAAWRTVRNDVGAEQNFDIVHAHLGEDLAIVPLAAAAARRHRAPLVVTVHTSLSYTFRASGLRSGLLRTLGGRLERWGERRADALIGLTNRLGRLAQAGGVPAERVYVIPSGVNPARFDPGRAIRERERESKGVCAGNAPRQDTPSHQVGFVGRLVPQKGVRWLIDAAAILSSPDTSVLVIGDGPERRDLERRVAALGLTDRVQFTGFVPHQHLGEILAGLDVLVMPSVYEELGSTLLEGMWTGVPIVATRVGGIPEVIRHRRTGLLVRPEDPHALADAIDLLTADPELAASLARNAREAAARYDWEVLARSVLGVYTTVLNP